MGTQTGKFHENPLKTIGGVAETRTSVDKMAKTDKVGWLVGFGFNGPLRQYFSLYRAVSHREGERGKKR